VIPDLLPGDIILTKDTGFVSKSIRLFGSLQTGDCRVNHAALALGKIYGEEKIIESLMFLGNRINQLSKYDGKRLIVYRLKAAMGQREEVAKHAVSYVGDSYGITKIPLFALDATATGVSRIFGNKEPVYFFTDKIGRIKAWRVCSQFAVYLWQKHGGYSFPFDWRVASPDTLDDWCIKTNQEVVYTNL
jgi:hypothetical protein